MRTGSYKDNYDSKQIATLLTGVGIVLVSLITMLIANDVANDETHALIKEQRLKAMAISIEEYKARNLNNLNTIKIRTSGSTTTIINGNNNTVTNYSIVPQVFR